MSGFASRNGEEGGDPLLPPLALADMIAGLYGSNALLMALRSRSTSGKGQVIDLALLDAMTFSIRTRSFRLPALAEAKASCG